MGLRHTVGLRRVDQNVYPLLVPTLVPNPAATNSLLRAMVIEREIHPAARWLVRSGPGFQHPSQQPTALDVATAGLDIDSQCLSHCSVDIWAWSRYIEFSVHGRPYRLGELDNEVVAMERRNRRVYWHPEMSNQTQAYDRRHILWVDHRNGPRYASV